MTDKTDANPVKKAPPSAAQLREARLKAALKANMARRKAQAKVRGGDKKMSENGSEAKPDPSSGVMRE